MTKKHEAIATMEKQDQVNTLPPGVPAHLQQYVGRQDGLEDVGKDDLLLPRLGISQGLSPQITKGKPEFIKDLRIGEFFNTVTGEIYGETVDLIPLFYFRTFVEFVPRDQGGGVVAQYQRVEDVPAGDLQFGPDGEKPKVTEFKNEMCLAVREGGRLEPIVASFKATGMKTARRWNSLMRQLKMPAYARVYRLAVSQLTNNSGTWYGATVEPREFVPENFFQEAQTYFDSLRQAAIQVDTTGLGPEAETSQPEEGAAF